MPHIHSEPDQYDQTASAFIFLLSEEGPKLLLLTHKILDVLIQPGGHVELTESPWQAVLHEIEEETGYELEQLSILQPDYVFEQNRIKLQTGTIHPVAVMQNSHLFGDSDPSHYHTDTLYAFTALEVPRNQPLDGESLDLRWVSQEQLEAFTDDEIVPDIRTIGSAIFNYHLENWIPVTFDQEGTHL